MSNRAERRRAEKAAAKGYRAPPQEPSYKTSKLRDLGRTNKPHQKGTGAMSDETLVACALIDENGEVKHGFKSHAELRQYEPANPAHTYGFWTSKDRFVSRSEAVQVGVASGQLSPDWLTVRRELLSADVW